MNALERSKYAKRAEIDKAKKERLHFYLDGEDVFRFSQDRTRLLTESGSGGIRIGDITLQADEFRALAQRMSDHERELMDAIISKYRAVETAGSEEKVTAIGADDGLPEVTRWTAGDLREEVERNERESPETQAVQLAKAMVNEVALPADKALEMRILFPVWGEKGAEFGLEVKAGVEGRPGFRFRYVPETDGEPLLYEVIQDHALSGEWKPDENMALYKLVTVEHAGTLADPIPYSQGMAFEEGKYYEQYGVTYLCVLTTSTGYPYDLKDIPTIAKPV